MASDDRKPRVPKASTTFEAVQGLSEQARLISDGTSNPVLGLAGTIRALIASEVDPYILMGILLEGMVQTLTMRIPASRQPDTVLATLMMLQNRLRVANGGSDPLRCDSSPGAMK